jgi:hypothetical protein
VVDADLHFIYDSSDAILKKISPHYFTGKIVLNCSAAEVNQLGNASNVMLSNLIKAPKRKYYPAVLPIPTVTTSPKKKFLRFSTYGNRSLFLWK